MLRFSWLLFLFYLVEGGASVGNILWIGFNVCWKQKWDLLVLLY